MIHKSNAYLAAIKIEDPDAAEACFDELVEQELLDDVKSVRDACAWVIYRIGLHVGVRDIESTVRVGNLYCEIARRRMATS